MVVSRAIMQYLADGDQAYLGSYSAQLSGWAHGLEPRVIVVSGGPHGLQRGVIPGIRPVWDLPRTLGLKCSEPGVESPMLAVVNERYKQLRPGVQV